MPFALDHDAAYLEAHAQAWADAHWSETSWLTGHIRQDRVDAMCDELERERRARRGNTQPLIDLAGASANRHYRLVERRQLAQLVRHSDFPLVVQRDPPPVTWP
ncbi:MAG: hypothetical protein M3457_05180, partial [Chloroflexota bacterium]|nr:hypothetical protein [Chloroflexota bacterium]